MKNLIKVERAKLNITQEELAQQLNVSRQSVNAIETGKFVPSTILALKMARYFKISIHDIFELENND
jgi:putative transcriptional regulator